MIHDLIFKRKSATGALNDLWILNEEFVHFEGCSELPLDQITLPDGQNLIGPISPEMIKDYGLKPTRRPDIFLYPDEGKCILVELKEPDTDLSDHLNQVVKYANFIANFSTQKIEKFFCYLIGENISRIDLPTGDFELTVTGDWIRSPMTIKSIKPGEEEKTLATASLEIMKLSSIADRAHRRNKSFANKLGIREETLERAASVNTETAAENLKNLVKNQ